MFLNLALLLGSLRSQNYVNEAGVDTVANINRLSTKIALKWAIYLSARDKNFFTQMFSLSYVQTNPDGRKISKNLKLGLFGP